MTAHLVGRGAGRGIAARSQVREAGAMSGCSDPPAMLDAALHARARGQIAEAREAFAAAYASARAAGDPRTAAEALLGLGGPWVNDVRTSDERARYHGQLRAVLTELAEDDGVVARLNMRLAADTAMAMNGAQRSIGDAMHAVRRTQDPTALAEALLLAHHLLLDTRSHTERAEVGRELLEVAAASDDDWLLAQAMIRWVADAYLRGDPDAARELNRLRQWNTARDMADVLYFVAMVDVLELLRNGQLALAEQAMELALAQGVELGEPDAFAQYCGQLLTLRWLQGRADELLPTVRELSASPQLMRTTRVFHAVAAALLARNCEVDAARVALLRADPFGAGPDASAPSSAWMMTMFAAVEAVAALNDVDGARQAYETLLPFAELPVVASIGTACLGSTHRLLAIAARVFGDSDTAVKHLNLAVDHNLRLGQLPMLAICRAELASTMQARGRPGDQERACELLDAAVAAAAAFGMTAHLARWERRLARVSNPTATLRRRANGWELSIGERTNLLPALVGMDALAGLLERPHVAVPAAELLGGVADIHVDPVLDNQSIRAMRARALELVQALDDADGRGDEDASLALHVEYDAVTVELTRALRPDGRSRTFSTAADRARTAAQKALRRALDRIAEVEPRAAAELRTQIRTGYSCRFEANPEMLRWVVIQTSPH